MDGGTLKVAGIVAGAAVVAAGCSGGPAIDNPPGSVTTTSSTTQPHQASRGRVGGLDLIIGDLNASLGQDEGGIFDD